MSSSLWSIISKPNKPGGIEMTNLITDLSQQKAVTLLRIMYPIWAIVGLFSIMYIPATLIAPGDAAATANNIMDNELLFRMGIVGSLITQLIFILVVLVLFKLFKQVNENHASLMVIFALVSVPIAMLNTLNRVAALLLLSSADYLNVFGADQLHAQMMFFLNLNEQGVFIASILSGYFPRILGVLMIIAGFGYLIDFFTHFLLPNYETIGPVLEVMTIGETIFMAWVLLKGAKIPERNPEIT